MSILLMFVLDKDTMDRQICDLDRTALIDRDLAISL